MRKRRRRSGVSVTVNSTLVLLALCLGCCALSGAVAVWKAQSDPAWRAAHTLLGLLCSGGALLLAALCVGVVLWRVKRAGERPLPPDAG